MADSQMIESAYNHYLDQIQLQTSTSPVIINQKYEVDFITEMMLKPSRKRLRRSFQTGLWAQIKTSAHQLQLHAKVNRLQIDNQLYDCVFPVVLAPVPPPKSVAAKNGKLILQNYPRGVVRNYRSILDKILAHSFR